MAIKKLLKSGVTVVWGTDDLGYTAHGIVEDAGIKQQAQKEVVPDENGETAGLIFYDDTQPITLSIIMSSSAEAPAVGDTITVDSVEYIVDDAEEKWNQKGFKKLSINATKYAATLVAETGT